MAQNSFREIDCIIVGAGVSGLYCAYKMSQNEVYRIVVLEKSDRIGGNLKSEFVTINGHTIVQEEGGMRFYANKRVYNLAKELGLGDDIIEFKNGCDNNINYFRGCRFTDAKADNHIWYKLYDTGLNDKDIPPFQILNDIFFKVMKMNNATEIPRTIEEWQVVGNWTVKDESGISIPLYQWDFKKLLLHFELNLETIKMIKYSMGWENLFCREWNSLYCFQSNLYFTLNHPPFHTLKHGLNQIPLALSDRIAQNGIQVRCNAEVSGILLSENEFPITVEYIDHEDDNSTKLAYCKQLVLAIPQLSLIELASRNHWIRECPNFDKYINGVISPPVTKIRLYFEKQWWRDLGFSNGVCHTDLRIGNIYIFTPIDAQEDELGQSHVHSPGSLMIYNDSETSLYWHSLQFTDSVYIPLIEPPRDSVLAKTCLVNVLMNQLNKVLQFPNSGCQQPGTGTDKLIIPVWPVLATYTYWGDKQFGDSTHAWKVGVDDSVVSPAMYTLLGDRIAIIGESYSIAQEWIEGALHHTDGYLNDVMKFKL